MYVAFQPILSTSSCTSTKSCYNGQLSGEMAKLNWLMSITHLHRRISSPPQQDLWLKMSPYHTHALGFSLKRPVLPYCTLYNYSSWISRDTKLSEFNLFKNVPKMLSLDAVSPGPLLIEPTTTKESFFLFTRLIYLYVPRSLPFHEILSRWHGCYIEIELLFCICWSRSYNSGT